ncbi:MAG: hypothetical protein LBJ83_03375 [Oscillospiraceae bacterium]|nr:hypothetical protein [Oscillospiraceae bacterium]
MWTMKTYKHQGYLNKPFVQFRACFVPKTGLWVRALAYENAANYRNMKNYQDNHIALYFYFNSNEQQKITTTININGEHLGFESFEIKMLQGEDLQGIFWGFDVNLTNKAINKFCSRDLNCGDIIGFNAVKQWLTTTKYCHSGILFHEPFWGKLTRF